MDTYLCVVASTILAAVIHKLNLRFHEAVDRHGPIISTLRLNIEEILSCALVAEAAAPDNDILSLTCEWLKKVQLVAYEADDLFDLFRAVNSEPTHLFGLLSHNFWAKSNIPLLVATNLTLLLLVPVQFPIFRINNLSFRFKKLLEDAKKIVPGADDAVRRCSVLREHIQARSFHHPQVVDELMSILESKSNKVLLGLMRDEMIKSLVERLMVRDNIDEPEIVQISVIPIVGIAGIGKTTLASMVYNDQKVLKHFELRTWVCVSYIANKDSFVSSIAKGIIESVTGLSCQLEDDDELYDLVRDTLESERSLIVLDDIPYMDYKTWQNILKSLFCTVGLGSKVIITTCKEDFGKFAAITTDEPYMVSPLSNQDSWSLFSSLAFDSSSRITKDREIELANDIILGCEGNPLFLIIMGSLVRFFKEESEWLSFNSYYNQIRDSSSTNKHALLSYYALPSHLKQCFAYCSVFLRDCVIEKEKVIRMWIAEGLVQSSEEKKTLEDIGNDYFRELLCRSFFKDSKRNNFGDVIECRIGGVFESLAASVAGFEYKEMDGVESWQSKHFRLGSLAFSSRVSTVPKSLDSLYHLRTLLLLPSNFNKTLDRSFLRFKFLRVLDLSCSGIQKLPSQIHTLQHLRYLDLSHTLIEKLPSAITKIKYLQTLKLLGCYRLQKLPKRMHNMANLRHLDVWLCHSLSHIPSGISRLRSLQSMPLFVLGKTHQCAHLGELRRLNLRGMLEIRNLENVRSVEEARESKLYEKENLNHLGLSWGDNVNGCSKMLSESVLESLWPHPNLKVLDISGYKHFKFPSWMSDSSINNLVKVSITNCHCEKLPPLGQLPYLKKLCIKGMANLKSIGQGFYGGGYSVGGFPSLEQFELDDMCILEEWTTEFPLKVSTSSILNRAFPCLDTLTVGGCSVLKCLPSLPSLNNLVLWRSNEILLDSLMHLTSISSVVINDMQFRVFPKDLGNLNSVKKLMLYHCGDLDSLFEKNLKGFSAVEHLGILSCYDLTSLGTGLKCLTSLQKLEIIECHGLELLPEFMEKLTLLRELIIDGCRVLTLLPEGIRFLTSLQKLIIKRCHNLLRLPEGLGCLTSLQYLMIAECPQMDSRLKKDVGEDWFKIAHVPCIIINHTAIIEQSKSRYRKSSEAEDTTRWDTLEQSNKEIISDPEIEDLVTVRDTSRQFHASSSGGYGTR